MFERNWNLKSIKTAVFDMLQLKSEVEGVGACVRREQQVGYVLRGVKWLNEVLNDFLFALSGIWFQQQNYSKV